MVVSVVFVALGLGLGCAAHEAALPPAAGAVEGASSGGGVERPLRPFQVGRASYYSDRLAGRRTASGERYDPRALTAAHPSLPFGSVVRVERSNGRSVDVRINDRGPFVRGRIIDLSRRAAEQIGLVSDGVGHVALRLVYVPRRGVRASNE
jgi:rare lipoprotein A